MKKNQPKSLKHDVQKQTALTPGLGVSDLTFRVKHLAFRVSPLAFRVSDLRFKV